MNATRRLVLSLAAAALCTGAHAQGAWPAKPIRMIVPLAAGSAVFTVNALFAWLLAKSDAPAA